MSSGLSTELANGTLSENPPSSCYVQNVSVKLTSSCRSFGFGLMDAEKMVSLAKSWQAVPAQRTCVLQPDSATPLFGSSVSSTLTVDSACEIGRLEHVRVNFTVLARRRGAVRLELTSPMGTTSKIIPNR